jgi:subfamily B ATP-binding cassette protein MsbA
MQRLTRLLYYVRRYIPQLLFSLPLAAGVGAADAFRLLLIGPILDRVLRPDAGSHHIVLARLPGTQYTLYLQQFVPEHFKNAWTMVAFALVAATLIKGICDYASTYLVYYAGFGLITDLRNDLYNAILRRSAGFFARYSTGTLISTIVNDVERIQVAMGSVLAESLQQLFVLLFTVYVVISLGGKLAWVLLLFVPFVVVSAGRIGRRVRHTTRRGQDKLADVQNILHETITGNRIVKAFGTERWESLRFHGASQRLFHASMRSVRAVALSSPLMDLFGAAAIGLLLLLGRDRINHHVFTPGTFLAFIFAILKLYEPVRKFALYNNSFQQALGASATLFSYMDEKDDVHEKPRAAALPNFSRSVRFEHVNFSYGTNGEGDREVLRDIDLEARRGEVLAIVGSSGAGKSTLVHLIPRFFDATGGRILIDGHDVRDVTLASLRRQIGIVTQDTILFNDTVRNNIAYGQPHVSASAVIAAATAALAHDFIQKLPDGYDTIIGERGLLLSGGERQRIAIARALLKNAPILILDEATSALDSESEGLVQSALQNLMVGRTVFVIAHRLSTVRRADRIVVLEDGRITDIGTHEDLLSRLGTYRRLYDLQFLDVEPSSMSARLGS